MLIDSDPPERACSHAFVKHALRKIYPEGLPAEPGVRRQPEFFSPAHKFAAQIR